MVGKRLCLANCLYSVVLWIPYFLSFLHTEGTESGSTLSSKIETWELEFLTVARSKWERGGSEELHGDLDIGVHRLLDLATRT